MNKNLDIILDTHVIEEINGIKYKLKIPTFREHLEYMRNEKLFKEQYEKEKFSSSSINFVYNFCKVDFTKENMQNIELYLICLKLTDGTYWKKEDEKIKSDEKEKTGKKIAGVDATLVIDEVISFYGYKDIDILEMTVCRFYSCYRNISRIKASEKLEKTKLYMIPSNLKTEKGFEIYKNNIETWNKVLETAYDFENEDLSWDDFRASIAQALGTSLGGETENGDIKSDS